MIVPTRLGNNPPSSPFIYTAGDSHYFELHGKPLINSILTNTNYPIHIHLYNPNKKQLEWLQQDRVTYSYEKISVMVFEDMVDDWLTRDYFDNHREKQMYDKGILYGREKLLDIIIKTYYACCRFIRLNEILSKGSRCLAIDIDGIVIRDFQITMENEDKDFYLYRKQSGEHLAGAILFTERSKQFLSDFANNIYAELERDNIYWFLDQVELDKCVAKYNAGLLPIGYIDWEMNENSYIWSAKGNRKSNCIFINEQQKYNF